MYVGLFTKAGEVAASGYQRMRIGPTVTFAPATVAWGVIRRYGVFATADADAPQELHELAPLMVVGGMQVTLDLTSRTLSIGSAGATAAQRVEVKAGAYDYEVRA